MYGLIIGNVLGYLRSHYHPKRYEEITGSAKMPFEDKELDIYKVYPEGIIQRLVKKASIILQVSEKEIFEGVGVYFVTFYSKLGYRDIVARIGRYFREFIINLDNCHDYFKLTFTKLRAPSFFVDEEHERGLKVIYRSKRRGFTYYVLGQMKEIAKTIFKQSIKIEIKRQEVVFDTVIVSFNLEFDNSAFIQHQHQCALRQEASLPIRARILFEIFPFAILFNDNLVITLVGASLRLIMPGVIGQSMNKCFALRRPLIEFNAEQMMQRTNNVFVFKALMPRSKIHRSRMVRLKQTDEQPNEALKTYDGDTTEDESDDDEEDDGESLQLKGVVMYMPMWKKILFLGCPIVKGLVNLAVNGLYINDLSIHDYSRDLVITSNHTRTEEKMTKMLVEQNTDAVKMMREKAKTLREDNDKKFVGWIPQQIEIGLPEKRVQKLDFAALLFASVDKMDYFAAKADAVALVDLLDDLTAVFEHLSSTIGLLTVQTPLMLPNGGTVAPPRSTGGGILVAVADYTAGLSEESQVERVATMALDLEAAAKAALREPLPRGKPLKMRTVILTGPAVLAVVGRKLPKFCVFGPVLARAQQLHELVGTAGHIVAPEEITFQLTSAFRFTKASSHRVDCVYIDEKEDHKALPVLHILQVMKAYAAFKSRKHRAIVGSSSGGEGAATKENGDGDVGNNMNGHSDRGDGCNGFLESSSRLCHIL